MSIRKLVVLASLAAVGLLSLGSGAASASVALRIDPGNQLLGAPFTITNTSSGPSVFTLQGLGTFTCNQTTSETRLHANSGASSITGTLNALTLTSCVDTLPVMTIPSCTLDPTAAVPTVHITSDPPIAGVNGQLNITDLRIRCNIAGSSTSFCYFTYTSATAIGNVVNATSTITFPGVVVHHVTGTGDLGGVCGSQANFTTTLRHIVEVGTNRTVTVTTS
jgi:hypothetical protein